MIAAFLAAEPAAAAVPLPPQRLPPSAARPAGAGWQLLPGGEAGGDGFYYACLTRHGRQQAQ